MNLIEEDNENAYEVNQGRKQFQNLINQYYTKITYEYAAELESLGLWKWAVFVVLHLDNNRQKSEFIKRILLKYIGTDDQSSFLQEKCGIPAHYIHEAKAIYYEWKGLYGKSFYEWIKGEYYQNAHDTLIKYLIISSESAEEKFSDLDVILERLNENRTMIINWDSQGDILYEFIQIRKQIIAYQNNFIDRYGSFIKSSLNKSNHRIDDLNKLTNRLSTLIHSFKKFRVEDLSQTAMAVKTELKRILLGWDSDLCMIKSILNKDSGELLVPNQILMDSEDLNLNDKNNALKKYVSQTLPHFICEF